MKKRKKGTSNIGKVGKRSIDNVSVSISPQPIAHGHSAPPSEKLHQLVHENLVSSVVGMVEAVE